MTSIRLEYREYKVELDVSFAPSKQGSIQEPLEIDSRNTPDYHKLLRQGWLEKTSQKLVAA